MTEYNVLTQSLLQAGYTKEQYPDYVRLVNGVSDQFELHGGFEYSPWYLKEMVFSTACGILVRHSDFLSHKMGYQGIWWEAENDNAVIYCPYRVTECEHRHPSLNDCTMSFCNCHRVKKKYDYEQSVQKIYDEQEKRKNIKLKEFSDRMNQRICLHHMKYDWKEEAWSLNYNPCICAKVCGNSWCTLRDVPLSSKRGHVYYDLEISRIRQDETVFCGQHAVNVIKGIRFLKQPVSMSICKEIAKHCKKIIEREERLKYHAAIFADPTLNLHITKVYCASRPSRDLIKDLEDIKNGIHIVHASDEIKQSKEKKSEHRMQLQLQNERKLEKKILANGFDSFPEYSPEYKHAVKWFGWERIARLEEQRKAAKEETWQETSLSDYL